MAMVLWVPLAGAQESNRAHNSGRASQGRQERRADPAQAVAGDRNAWRSGVQDRSAQRRSTWNEIRQDRRELRQDWRNIQQDRHQLWQDRRDGNRAAIHNDRAQLRQDWNSWHQHRQELRHDWGRLSHRYYHRW
jgi:chromosome segregation ATPase